MPTSRSEVIDLEHYRRRRRWLAMKRRLEMKSRLTGLSSSFIIQDDLVSYESDFGIAFVFMLRGERGKNE